jgi:hypothetical protein
MPDGFTYIDGFNLFHGLQAAGLRQYYWLDLHKLASKILSGFGFAAEFTRYYTTRVPNTHNSFETQRVWLDAVDTLKPQVQTEWGLFQQESLTCPRCGDTFEIQREKKTDVNLGIQVLEDVVRKAPNVVLLITGDSDHVPTVAALKRWDNRYPVCIAFPPRRHSNHLSDIVGRKSTIDLTEDMLSGCCLPDVINDRIFKPVEWN